MSCTIWNVDTGYALRDEDCETIATYTRRRDAVRGAKRRGFTVTN